MPKSFDKTKGNGVKRHAAAASSTSSSSSSLICSASSSEHGPARKKKKSNTDEGIAKSKQLVEKLQRTHSTRTVTNKKNEPRLCGNGKPMPSLADLERMYEDSVDDTEQPVLVAASRANTTSRCKTPEQPLLITEEKLMSPKTIHKIATKMMDIIEKIPPIVIDETPPPPVIPPKKRKKPDVPYIVGCSERPQVPWAPKTNVFKGDEDYGVDPNGNLGEDEQNSCPKKRRRATSKLTISKSIFNAKGDEIALRLIEAESEEVPRTDSPDSDKTIDQNSPSQMSRSFSPLPSTSTDNETFLINTQRFKESLIPEILCDDVEVIEIPYETIALDDTTQDRGAIKVDNVDSYTEDDCCIVEPVRNIRKRATISPITIDSQDDFYSSLDLTQSYDKYADEIIDVDDVIAENNAIIEKYRNESDLDAVILVEPSTSCSPKQSGPKNDNVSVNVPPRPNSDSLKVVKVGPPLEVNNAQIPNKPSLHDVDVQVVDSENILPQTHPNRTGKFYSHATLNTNPENLSDLVAVLSVFQQSLMDEIIESNSSRNSRLNTMEQQINDLRGGNVTVTNITSVPANNNNLNINQRLTQNHVQVNRADNSTLTEKSQENASQPRLGDCPICMDNLSGKSIASTLCGHVFCLNCIRAAIRTGGKKCPTCRKSLRGVGFHQIFL